VGGLGEVKKIISLRTKTEWATFSFARHFEMSDRDLQRQLLMSLMEPLLPDQKKDFRDANVCKSHLVAFCPHELLYLPLTKYEHKGFLFVTGGTLCLDKVDLGKCNLLHEDKLALEYRNSPLRGKLGYEYDFNEYLLKLVRDIDWNIKKGHQRLIGTQDSNLAPSQDHVRENIISLEAMAEPKLEALEHFGRLGRIKEAYELWQALEKIHNELEIVKQDDLNSINFRPDKRMEVCTVCGALLANDATGQRIEGHMIGKQHTGYLKIREAIEIFKVVVTQVREHRPLNQRLLFLPLR
jgi:LUC7 N_terminus